ncbi:lysophospholipid acyltransferase LPEAT2-like [Pistacia vera]|uniref:lysophospholipid acyltransferase LPEAT2-like n=1 Tax=Pistacia vera TaxID=55513 RepID=UPI0012634229|nr:lysophospholipid acyltransferase LPEAT2-like [Pistacia vera]XP_031285330.1 lysophospholipid acyltransferase LPEAT2-like [Pistacia vera]
MADHDVSSPLLQSPRADHTQVIIAVDDDSVDEPLDQLQPSPIKHNHNHSHNHLFPNYQSNNSGNPYEFIGSDGFSVSGPSTLNPFQNETPEIDGVYEVLKIVLCLPIALIRLVLFGLCLLVGYLATKLALEGWKDKQNPMPLWRSRLMWVTRICARCILFSFGYHWIRRKGKPASREIAPIIVSNHVSYIEPIFYFYELCPTIVASESHDSIPFVGTIIRAMQVIYVNRFSQSSRKNAVNEIKRKASCDRFPRVLLFPEGTTTNGKALISFQLGAFIPGFPIQPVVVRYPHIHFDQSWGDISLAKLMFRMFTQFHNFMEIEYLPVVHPNENNKENAFHFAERTSHAIASALNVVQTSHSYGDLMLLNKASQSKQGKSSSYMVEMARVESLFHISSLEAVDFLDKFLSMNPDSSGHVKLLDFLRVLRLKSCNLSQEIFGFVDVDKNGSITFKQFLYASAHVMKLPLFRQACELAFAECDTEGNGYIKEHELGLNIRPAIPDLNKDEIHGLFSLFDSDGDGEVSKDEFVSSLRKNPLLIAVFSPSLLHRYLSGADNRTLEIV